jgi:hypothetical protein
VSSDLPVLYATILHGDKSPLRPERDLKLLDSEIRLLGENTMGEIVRASIDVEAEVRTLWYDTPSHGSPSSIIDNSGNKCGILYLDDVDNKPSTKKLCMCLRILDRSTKGIFEDEAYDEHPSLPDYSSVNWTYFLVVVLDASSTEEWRRVGLGRSLTNLDIFNNCERKKIRLI